MIVIPCSAGALSRIAHGLSTDLVGRAADVVRAFEYLLDSPFVFAPVRPW